MIADAGNGMHHLYRSRSDSRLADRSIDRIAVSPLRIVRIFSALPCAARRVAFIFIRKIYAGLHPQTDLLVELFQIVYAEFQSSSIEESVARDFDCALDVEHAMAAETLSETASDRYAAAARKRRLFVERAR